MGIELCETIGATVAAGAPLALVHHNAPLASEVAAEKPKIVDLLAALDASVEAAKPARKRHPKSTKAKAKKSS